LDQSLPVQKVIFGYRASSNAFGWIVGEIAVFLKKTALGGSGRHDGIESEWFADMCCATT
jgi:hypothetical protein